MEMPKELGLSTSDGVVRLSLVHYNNNQDTELVLGHWINLIIYEFKKFKEILKNLNYSNSFKPTETSRILINGVTKELNKLNHFHGKKFLDLGCGSGILTILLNNTFPNNHFFASDLDDGAVLDSNLNFKNFKIKAKAIKSNIFDRWEEKFDFIIDDISGVSSLLISETNWFDNSIPSEDEDGTFLLNNMLKQAKYYLNPNGIIFFPILSVSNHNKAIKKAKENFKISLIEKSYWPVPDSLKNKRTILETLKKKKIIDFEEKFGSIFSGLVYIWDIQNES